MSGPRGKYKESDVIRWYKENVGGKSIRQIGRDNDISPSNVLRLFRKFGKTARLDLKNPARGAHPMHKKLSREALDVVIRHAMFGFATEMTQSVILHDHGELVSIPRIRRLVKWENERRKLEGLPSLQEEGIRPSNTRALNATVGQEKQ